MGNTDGRSLVPMGATLRVDVTLLRNALHSIKALAKVASEKPGTKEDLETTLLQIVAECDEALWAEQEAHDAGFIPVNDVHGGFHSGGVASDIEWTQP